MPAATLYIHLSPEILLVSSPRILLLVVPHSCSSLSLNLSHAWRASDLAKESRENPENLAKAVRAVLRFSSRVIIQSSQYTFSSILALPFAHLLNDWFSNNSSSVYV